MRLLFPALYLLFYFIGAIDTSAQGLQVNTGLEAQSFNVDSAMEAYHFSKGIYLSKNWKYKKGDNPLWSKTIDDADWEERSIRLSMYNLQRGVFEGNCWFRQSFRIEDSLVGRPLGLMIEHFGASEVYLNGKLLKRNGVVGSSKEAEFAKNPGVVPLFLVLKDTTVHHLAIRYSNHRFVNNYNDYDVDVAGINLRFILHPNYTNYENIKGSSFWGISVGVLCGLLVALSLIHLLLFLFYKENKSNLYYSLFTFFYGFAFLSMAQHIMYGFSADTLLLISRLSGNSQTLLMVFLIVFLYSIFYDKFPKSKWVLYVTTAVVFVDEFVFGNTQFGEYFAIFATAFYIIEPIRLIVVGLIKKKKGSKIIGSGVLVFLVAVFSTLGIAFVQGDEFVITGWYNLLLTAIILLSIPISMSIFLAKEFANINHELKAEKENLEVRVVERTKEIAKQKEVIEEAHQEITDSINYAKRIQSAILPPDKLVKEYLEGSFILYKPKDIVAGDFYWMEPKDDKVFFAAADCTGHGVPGAMVSVICNNGLNRSVREYGITDPGEILDNTRELIIKEFEKSEEEVKDGMDIALCVLKGNQLEYAGAHNPLWIIRNGSEEIEEIKADKQPIGKFDNPQPHTTHTVGLNKGDTFYVFSDGYADQFGGPKGKKFMSGKFKKLLLSIQTEPIEKHKDLLNKAFEEWKGSLDQLDDVCVIGVRMQ